MRFNRPSDLEIRIVPAKASLPLRRVEIAHEVNRLSVIGQSQNCVRKSARYIHHQAVALIQLCTKPLTKSGRVRAKIDDGIPQSSFDTPYDLYFRIIRKLVVHSAQGSLFCRQRIVDLNKRPHEARLVELVNAKQTGEKAPVITAPLGLDCVCTFERGRVEFHAQASPGTSEDQRKSSVSRPASIWLSNILSRMNGEF